MFQSATAFNQDISGWDVSKLSTFANMFNNATSFNQPIGNWTTSSVNNTFTMFNSATAFDQDISNWDVSSVGDMLNMFNGITLSIENYDALLNRWSTQALQTNVDFSAGNSRYCQGEEARQKLIDDFGWTITDEGKLEDCDSVEAPADLVAATFLEGSRNPLPTGPILRAEQGNREIYLKYDLSSFGSSIAEATLQMQIASDPGNGTLQVFLGSNSNWTETGLNGSNKPAAVGNALASISGTHSLGQIKTWNLDASRLTGGGEITLIVKHSNGNDVAFASDETNQAPQLSISSGGVLVPKINSISFVNARKTIELYDGIRFESAAEYCDFALIPYVFRAETHESVKSVEFTLTGPNNFTAVSNDSPFALFDSDIDASPPLSDGDYVLFATAYTEPSAQGLNSEVYEVTFVVRNGCDEAKENTYIEVFNASSCESSDGIAILRGELGAPFDGPSDENWVYDTELQAYKSVDLSPGSYSVLAGGPNCAAIYEFVIEADNCPETNETADLIDATYLEGTRNPLPTGPILRAEQGNREVYMKFDLSAFSGSISEAELQMQVASDPGNGILEVFQGSNSNWTEIGLNGSNKPVAVGNALASISGTHSLGQTKTWNLDVSQITGGGLITLIVKHSSGNDVAFASDETNQAPKLIITSEDVGADTLNSLSLSPNPASVDIAVGFEEPRQVGAIFVYDVSGKLVHAVPAGEVKSEGNYQMNVSSLPSGMYFVRTFDADGIPHQKAMVIEH
ncbi:MAG: BspA family leucine-rich repeat surface protein, partial [Maribacter sp.]